MTRIHSYETLVILKSAGSEQDLARRAAELEEPIKKLGGRIERSQSLGRRRLAYRIARHAEGHYHLLRFAAPTDRISDLRRIFGLNEAIIRFIVLTQDDAVPAEPRRMRSGPASARAAKADRPQVASDQSRAENDDQRG